MIYLRGGIGPPFEGLGLVFLPMDISMVGWLPWTLSLSASSSLISLRDFLPALLERRSMASSSEEPELSIGFFLVTSV